MKRLICSVLFVPLIITYSHSQIKNNELKVYTIGNETKLSLGDSGTITLRVEIPKYAHIYGNPKGPGTGKSTTIDVTHPDDLIFGPPKFLPPKKYFSPEEKDFVWIYENKTTILIPFRVNKRSNLDKSRIIINFNALLCNKSSCILQSFQIEHYINYSPLKIKERFVNKNLIPKNIVSTSNRDKKGGIDKEGDIKTSFLQNESFKPRYISTDNIVNIFQAIFFGLIAGIILNFMPCVLPVVSLKILGFVKHAGKDKKILSMLGFLFSLGILTSFAILALLAAFWGYNWGELFQKGFFLIAMITVVFALTLSLFDVFVINIPSFAGKASAGLLNPYIDAYLKGLLATLLATPCSGPFLGGTLAWALIHPPIVIFIIFISVGIGMALPYLILTLNPKLLKFIPKSGDWMIAFERIMAFLLMGTTIYLIGILDQDLVMPTLWFLLFFSLALWQYGRYGAIYQSKKNRVISRIAAVIIILFGCYFSYDFAYQKNSDFKNVITKHFDLMKLYNNRDLEKISIIEFTADWCPNCKLVDKTSIYTQTVMEKIRDNNIEILIADLTRENKEAKELLTKLGSRSIPFLAVFSYGGSFYKPICLRDIFSEDDVIEAIEIAQRDAL